MSLTFACLWDVFPPSGLSPPALIGGFVPNLIASCYAVFCGYPREVCSFLEGNREAVGLRDRDGEAGRSRGRRLQSG